ncbi:hypothetical protein DSO57_1011328 [Entomophthora muscae]|uniref:Uncharacterized protein n=1 Tax=Entomophthora muscae TaxID=34485 RepID=A0ACC2T6I6_9FUNG|nr:hypothetical protein DSO57_1011328 [Entomophthora muscae]
MANSFDFFDIRANPEKTLVTMAFLGGEFMAPGASVKKTMDALTKCLDLLVKKTKAKHFLIFTSHQPASLPVALRYHNLIRSHITFLAAMIQAEWSTTLETFRSQYPNVTFYSYDFKEFLTNAVDLSSPQFNVTTTGCLSRKSENSITLVKCAEPDDHLFYDDFYLTTAAHRKLAESILAFLHPGKIPRAPAKFNPIIGEMKNAIHPYIKEVPKTHHDILRELLARPPASLVNYQQRSAPSNFGDQTLVFAEI